jgi:hypothetical protein
MTTSSIQVPLLFNYHISYKGLKPYVNGGLYATFLLENEKSGTQVITTDHQGISTERYSGDEIKYEMHDVNVGSMVNVGLLVPHNHNHLRLALRTDFDLFSRLPEPSPNILFFSLQVGYQLNLDELGGEDQFITY